MKAFLAATRFAPPRLGGDSITRERLLARLQDARERKVVFVSAGAGFGKTTLLAQHRLRLIASDATVAWLSLRQGEATPWQLCTHLIGALQYVGVALEEDLHLLGEGRAAGLHAVVAALHNSLMRLPTELHLMIDDFEFIADPWCVKLMQSLIDAAPPNLRIVLASRTVSPLLLGRLRAMGELEEITGADLAFDFSEAHAFLGLHLSKKIDIDAEHRIHDVTRGWPIGLQLVSISGGSSPKHDTRVHLIQSASDSLDAYLTEDVIGNLSPELLEFMQKLSILQRFNAPVAAHVTGFANSSELIAELEARNLFIMPVELHDDSRWYRFHPMFADFLGQRLASTPTSIAELHRRAALWFAEHDSMWEGMHHALVSGDFDCVMQVLESSPPPLTRTGHLNILLHWIECIPPALVMQHPRLIMMAAWACVLTVRHGDVERWIGALERTESAPDFAREVKLLKAVLAVYRDDTEQVLALVQSVGDAPLGEEFLEHTRISLTIAGFAYLGRHGEARSAFVSPAALVARSSTDEMALIVTTAAASAALMQGNIIEARRLAAVSLNQAESVHGRRSRSACASAAMMAKVLYELNLLEDARRTLADRLDILRLSSPIAMVHAASCYARLLSLQIGPRETLSYLIEEEAHFRHRRLDRGVTHMLSEQLVATLQLGDRRHGEALLAALDELSKRCRAQIPRDAEIATVIALSRARFALATREPERALQMLPEARTLAAAYGRDNFVVICDLLQARALQSQGLTDEAVSFLRLAVVGGFRLGLLRTFLDEGEQVTAMLADLQYAEGDPLQGYVHELLDHGSSDRDVEEGRSRPVAPSDPADASQFTKREIEILALLERSMSNKHIALALNLSIQTVKWNLKRIFAKFGVSSRYDAINAARRGGITNRARP